MENKQKPDNGIEIELTDEIAQGIYSNLAVIAHSSSEFVIDFVRVVPNAPKAKVKSRIILTPEHAKRLLAALTDNINKYENQFGPVNLQGQAGFIAPPILGPIGQA
ncbi:MAG: DUF3467 domain-containing protein [Dysgonamonadaceae bacterium]|jgi:hypothetical protein|nr:DUF3467 domain-containing protein [Dysgonamonadaceae bacterium]